MKTSETIKEIATALAKSQLEMKNPKFDATNPHFKNKYASLASVRDAAIPTLAKNGISCVQNIFTTEGGISCQTFLLHNSGEFIEYDPLTLPASKNDAQSFGSACTYARRYSLMACLSIVGDEDDDANAEVATAPSKATPINKEKPSQKLLSAEELLTLIQKQYTQEEINAVCTKHRPDYNALDEAEQKWIQDGRKKHIAALQGAA